MGRFRQEIPLIRLLDEVADGLANLEPGPILLAECPNKFNDAGDDDLWYAVQAGFEYWEQSHFFQYEDKPRVEEHSTFCHTLDPQTLKNRGGTVTGDSIAQLRTSLRHLETNNWRSLIGNERKYGYDDPPVHNGLIALVVEGWRSLTDRERMYGNDDISDLGGVIIALVIERGQRWLVLQHPNGGDAEIFAWDDDGFFHIGGMLYESARVDERIGERPILSFDWVEKEYVPRLGLEAQAFFSPTVRDKAAGSELAGLLWRAVCAIREMTVEPFGLLSEGSLRSYGSKISRWGWGSAEAFSPLLRPREGEFRRKNDGVWPKYVAESGSEPEEMSDFAKAMQVQLGLLEDARWREIFASACGENLRDLGRLGLIADTETAALVRGNAAFEVLPDALVPLGAFDYPTFLQLDETLEPIREAIRQRG
jgi:hypothetical protein